jgi:hypothetical protein
MKAMRGRIALPKHFVRNCMEAGCFIHVRFRGAYASSLRFSERDATVEALNFRAKNQARYGRPT